MTQNRRKRKNWYHGEWKGGKVTGPFFSFESLEKEGKFTGPFFSFESLKKKEGKITEPFFSFEGLKKKEKSQDLSFLLKV